MGVLIVCSRILTPALFVLHGEADVSTSLQVDDVENSHEHTGPKHCKQTGTRDMKVQTGQYGLQNGQAAFMQYLQSCSFISSH